MCDEGWGGANCGASVCARGCSGHGVCANSSCWCDVGWSGPECGWKRCLFDCSGHGTCDGRGHCACERGWGGFDCSEPHASAAGPGPIVAPASCSAHCLGTCRTRCAPIADLLGTEAADTCLLQCTDACVPACAAIDAESGHASGGASSAPRLPAGTAGPVDKADAYLWQEPVGAGPARLPLSDPLVESQVEEDDDASHDGVSQAGQGGGSKGWTGATASGKAFLDDLLMSLQTPSS